MKGFVLYYYCFSGTRELQCDTVKGKVGRTGMGTAHGSGLMRAWQLGTSTKRHNHGQCIIDVL